MPSNGANETLPGEQGALGRDRAANDASDRWPRSGSPGSLLSAHRICRKHDSLLAASPGWSGD